MDRFVVRRAASCSSVPQVREDDAVEARPSKKRRTTEGDTASKKRFHVAVLPKKDVLWKKPGSVDDEEEEDCKLDVGFPSEAALDEVVGENQDPTNGNESKIYRSSIYVDAFNLALDTVLEQEAHLFSENERAVFNAWRNLDYEAQYLYTRLFLRKRCAWHRTQNLQYQSNISDLDAAILSLKELRNGPDDQQGSFVFLETSEDHVTSVKEAVSLLSLDELKAMAKQRRVQGRTKAELQAALIGISTTQTALLFAAKKDDNSNLSSYERSLFQKVIEISGPCIRISSATFILFERVHLVFYRTWEWTEKSLTTILLAKFSKRNFPEYLVSRTDNIFKSREQLLEFEEALRLEHEVDETLNASGPPDEDTFYGVLACFLQISERWRQSLQDGQKNNDGLDALQDGGYLRRFCAAHAFTRIAHKAAYALGRLQEYRQEHELLTELLQQRLFHRARRGDWYQRKAQIEERYMSTAACSREKGIDSEQQKKAWYRQAAATCEAALQDPDCHLIYHHDLRKRLVKLERRLRIPRRLQHNFGHFQTLAPEEHVVEGIQIRREDGVSGGSKSTRTLWVDVSETENDASCTVEIMCLNHYQQQGWKGFHTEGGIVRTLFAYLFIDILFLYVPNVFQTAYQSAPLDLFTDAFYAARASEINRRLVQIANGEAERIVRDVYAAHFERRTCVVGLDWDFSLADMATVAHCFRGDALAAVCKVLAQEYGQRTGGLPDLLLWRCEPEPEVLFVEVKSVNDRLSDTQRLWIHVLLEAGAKVAVCHAVAKEWKSG